VVSELQTTLEIKVFGASTLKFVPLVETKAKLPDPALKPAFVPSLVPDFK
jgi:hypothetical protein